jgi:hypothetical protein
MAIFVMIQATTVISTLISSSYPAYTATATAPNFLKSDMDMTEQKNPYAEWPLHHLLFVKVRDGGGPSSIGHSVAKVHGLTLEELKAQCRKTGEEWIARDGALDVINQPVYDCAKA